MPVVTHIDINPFKENKIERIIKEHMFTDRQINQSSVTGAWQETRVLRLPDEAEVREWLREATKQQLFRTFKTKCVDQYYVCLRAHKTYRQVEEVVGFFGTLKAARPFKDGACRLFCKVLLKQGLDKKCFVCAPTNDDNDLWGVG